jgi:hypothetical protein
MLFVTMVEAKGRVIRRTERNMFVECEKEAAGGRVLPKIELFCAVLPQDLRTLLVAVRIKAPGESGRDMIAGQPTAPLCMAPSHTCTGGLMPASSRWLSGVG